jgi:hypothetical protein
MDAMTKGTKVKVERNSEGLRALLFDQIEKLLSGEGDIGEARAVASLAGQIVNTIHVEIAIAQLRRDYPADMKLIVPQPLKLDGK